MIFGKKTVLKTETLKSVASNKRYKIRRIEGLQFLNFLGVGKIIILNLIMISSSNK